MSNILEYIYKGYQSGGSGNKGLFTKVVMCLDLIP
jgi:hypothetical protein